jgi:putative pyruvate formate lyase activating enzyme
MRIAGSRNSNGYIPQGVACGDPFLLINLRQKIHSKLDRQAAMCRPSYVELYQSGELEKRVQSLNTILHSCTLCPRRCDVDRYAGRDGYCRCGHLACVCSYCDHHGEEPPLSGFNGSGTIFFGHCNLHCVFCQNADISQQVQQMELYEYTPRRLAKIMLHLQNEKKCHNINLVSPSHMVAQIVEALYIACSFGLNLPLVYNSNGYDSVETLQLLEGIIDIYLPDLKYANDHYARKYSAAIRYVDTARAAIKEMYRQVGLLRVDEQGIAVRGLIIRHLVLPNDLAGSSESLEWLAREISPEVTLSLMAQYYPANHASQVPLLSRPLQAAEYERVLIVMEKLGLHNSLYQDLNAAHHYRPHFFASDHPFA